MEVDDNNNNYPITRPGVTRKLQLGKGNGNKSNKAIENKPANPASGKIEKKHPMQKILDRLFTPDSEGLTIGFRLLQA